MSRGSPASFASYPTGLLMPVLLIVSAVLLAACAPRSAQEPAPAASASDRNTPSELPATSELVRLHERFRVDGLTEREFTHRELWTAIEPLVERSPVLERSEIGRSAEGRPIYAVRYGHGSTTVLLWSQMHGDESTATMTLADIFRFLADSAEHPLAARLAEKLTLVMVPMLNPDGAERFQRHNAFGIDVNRDARALSTPEGRALQALQQRLKPEFGFNLHDQNVRTRVGGSERLAAIALLAPAYDESRDYNEVRSRARQVAAVIRQAVEPLVGGHIARYDDTFNPRAFGDLIQSWGTSTVLIESGGWKDDPEKQYLRGVNFVGILSALDAIASGAYAGADPALYTTLPQNGRRVSDLLVRGGWLVLPGLAPVRADLTADYADPLRLRGGRITEVGDLTEAIARDTLGVEGLYLHPERDALTDQGGRPSLSVEAPASFVVRRGPEPTSEAVWVVLEGRAEKAGSPAPSPYGGSPPEPG